MGQGKSRVKYQVEFFKQFALSEQTKYKHKLRDLVCWTLWSKTHAGCFSCDCSGCKNFQDVECKCINCTKTDWKINESGYSVHWRGRLKQSVEQIQETVRIQYHNSYDNVEYELVHKDPIVTYTFSAHGFGECQWFDKDNILLATFIGEFENGMPVNGKIIYKNRNFYSGPFVDGLEGGDKGEIVWIDEKTRYDGFVKSTLDLDQEFASDAIIKKQQNTICGSIFGCDLKSGKVTRIVDEKTVEYQSGTIVFGNKLGESPVVKNLK